MGLKQRPRKKSLFIPHLTEGDFSAKKLKAKKKGLLSSIKPLIIRIRDNGIWIKDEIANGILKDAGEEIL